MASRGEFPSAGQHGPAGVVSRATRPKIVNADAMRLIEESLSELGLGSLVLERRMGGAQAEVLVVAAQRDCGTTNRFAVKSFRRDNPFNSQRAVQQEFEALVALHGALADTGDDRLRSPRPVVLLADAWMYIMTYVEGETLEQHVRSDPASTGKLPALMILGLRAYYRSVGMPYGDFSAKNVIVGNGAAYLCFLDPTYTKAVDAGELGLTCAPGSIDAAYWLHDALSRELRGSCSSPVHALAWYRLSQQLLHSAIEEFAAGRREAFLADVRKVVLAYLSRGRPRSPLHRLARSVKRLLLAAHLRALRSPAPGGVGRADGVGG